MTQHVIAALIGMFLMLVIVDEWHSDYKKREACQSIDALATAMNRELAPGHKCRKYLD